MERGLRSILRKRQKNSRLQIPEEFFNEDDSIPEVIKIYYKKNINLKQIDKIINVKLKKLNKLGTLEKYKNEAKEILESYNNDMSLQILENYLDIASKYIRIERIKTLENFFVCKGCNQKLENVTEEKEGFIVCQFCNCINSYLIPNHYVREIEKNIDYYDEDTCNFLKILDKFEGKTSLIIDKSFFEKLDDYFLNINFKTGEEIKKLPLNEYGKKDKTTKKMLWNAFEYLGYSQYYDETNYIAHVYWGWKLPELLNYKEKILRDYRNTQNVWNSIKHNYKRSASLGTQFRLYSHLKSCGFPNCFKEDFKLQENVESLRLHNDAWDKMCSDANIENLND